MNETIELISSSIAPQAHKASEYVTRDNCIGWCSSKCEEPTLYIIIAAACMAILYLVMWRHGIIGKRKKKDGLVEIVDD